MYYILSKFSVINVKDRNVLVNKADIEAGKKKLPYVYGEEIFDVISEGHERCVHGGIKKTYNATKTLAANITLDQVALFVKLCEFCKTKKSSKLQKPAVKSPIISNRFGQRGQVDLIDVKSYCDTNCAYVLNYQDNLTKFCLLKSLKDKSSVSVIEALRDIFNVIGAPRILHSDNGGEFRSKALKEYLREFWPELQVVHGKPYNPRSQGSVERANFDIKSMIICYVKTQMSKNNALNLVSAVSHIQFVKNASYNRTIKCSPYCALFGNKPVVEMNFERIYAVHKDERDDYADEESDTDSNDITPRINHLVECRKKALGNLKLAAEKSITL